MDPDLQVKLLTSNLEKLEKLVDDLNDNIDSNVSIFVRMKIPKNIIDLMPTSNIDEISLLSKKKLSNDISYISKMMSLDGSEAESISNDIVEDIARVTCYQAPTDSITVNDLIAEVQSLNSDLPLEEVDGE